MKNVLPQGMSAVRTLKALALANGSVAAAEAYAAGQHWSDHARVVNAIKASVEPVSTGQASALVAPVATEFAELVRPLTVLGKLQGVRRAPLRTRIVGQLGGASASWVGEGQPAPLSSAAFQAAELDARKVVAIVLTSNEVLRLASPGAEQLLRDDLARASAEAMDVALLDPDNAGGPETVPSVTHDAPSFESSGVTVAAFDADLAKLVSALTTAGSDLAFAAWVMQPAVALRLAQLRNAQGGLAYPGVTALGGILLGLPVITSASAPEGTITLIDGAGLLVADDDLAEFTLANHSTVAIEPEDGEGDPQLFSLWQTNCSALRIARYVSWRPRREVVAAALVGIE
jgi:HK97 family phage major capsid protein